MPEIKRILDANANRAREALRVMEEASRFVLDDAELTGALKRLRHDLAQVLGAMSGLEASRDTPGDVGTTLSTESESRRASIVELVTAAGKRLSEALRVIEEYAKLIDTDAAARAEALRYRGYDLEHRLALALGGGARRQWRVCVLITESLCAHHPWLDVARACVEGGADCIQLREKALESDDWLERTQALVALARPHGVSIVVNDRPDIALLGGADGVHLGQRDLSCKAVRRLAGGQLLVGVSTHELAHAEQAARDGADYCGVGPMFASTTKHKPHLAGPAYLTRYVQWGKLPHLAIGGISPDNVGELIDAGARGVAVSGCVCASEQPRAVVETLTRALERVAV